MTSSLRHAVVSGRGQDFVGLVLKVFHPAQGLDGEYSHSFLSGLFIRRRPPQADQDVFDGAVNAT